MTKFVFLFLFFVASSAHAGNIDLLWNGSRSKDIKSYTIGIDFSDDIAGKVGVSGYYRKGKAEGIITKDEGEIDLNYNPPINDKWSLWLDERVGYNKILGIDFENNLGVGLKYYAYKKGETKFSLSSGILYQFTSLSDSATQESRGRYSHRVKLNHDILSLLYFYQPNMHDNSDYIVKFIGDIRLVEIKSHISILFHYKNEYRSLIGRSENSGIKLRVEY